MAVLTLLALDGVLCAIAAALFLPLRIGTTPFPVSALLAGLVNAALVWVALHWTSAPRVASVPLWAWLLTVAVMALGGPGDDVVFGGSGVLAYAALLLIGFGVLPPVYVLWRYAKA